MYTNNILHNLLKNSGLKYVIQFNFYTSVSIWDGIKNSIRE